MISRSLQVDFAKAVMELRRASVPAYDLFMKTLTNYLDEVTEQMVGAAATDVHNHQGRAQAIRELFKILHESPQLGRDLQEKDALGRPKMNQGKTYG